MTATILPWAGSPPTRPGRRRTGASSSTRIPGRSSPNAFAATARGLGATFSRSTRRPATTKSIASRSSPTSTLRTSWAMSTRSSDWAGIPGSPALRAGPIRRPRSAYSASGRDTEPSSSILGTRRLEGIRRDAALPRLDLSHPRPQSPRGGQGRHVRVDGWLAHRRRRRLRLPSRLPAGTVRAVDIELG